MTVTLARIKASLEIGLAGTQQLGGPFYSADMAFEKSFADGTVANAVDRVYLAERTVTTGANDDIDLNAVLLDGLGAAISAVELVGVFIMNRRRDEAAALATPNTTNLTLGGSGSGVPGYTTAGLVLKPGGMFCHMNPDATGIATITASTGDIFRVTNSAGASNTYTIGFLLRSA